MKFGIFNRAVVTVYEGPFTTKEAEAGTVSAIADEGLYGMAAAVTGEEEKNFLPIKTCYGYTGYVKKEELTLVNEEQVKDWESSNLMVINGYCVDILSLPKVQGVCLLSLYKGALVQVEAWESETQGWAKVCLLDGRKGYVRNQFLRKKEFSQAGVWSESLPQKSVGEDAFRQAVTETAREYLGVQYRWGGKSAAGIDCSGLTSESYLLNGIITYRDASIKEGYPIRQIPMEQIKAGDLLYFPGHIAMYLGDGKYIHSTGKTGSGGVVINSLRPEDWDYREDLVKSLYAVGSLF